MKLLYPWHDLIINPPRKTSTSHKFAQKKVYSPICHEKLFRKRSPYTLGGTMPLLHWKIMWDYMFPQYFQVQGIKTY